MASCTPVFIMLMMNFFMNFSEFEEKLRTYSGDDPLEVWYEYVLWVEQNYPKGGKEGKLTKLIEKCLMAMYSSADLREKYVNDQRFLDIWIKYVSEMKCSFVLLIECCFKILIIYILQFLPVSRNFLQTYINNCVDV